MATIVYAFTGTRRGMTRPQTEKLFEVLAVLRPDMLTNGCCEGADRECHAVGITADNIAFEYFPSNADQEEWAMGVHDVLERVHPIMLPLNRNRLMVGKGKRGLIACPGTAKEVLRSGTWATWRYARNLQRPTWTIYPNGDLEVS